jgi:hypothetical protein
MDREDFDNVRDQVGFCGLWCGSCIVGNGVLRLLTSRYRQLTEAYGLRKWAPRDFDYDEFDKGLQSIGAMPSCPGCLKGGGRDNCEIRACAKQRGEQECWACTAGDACAHRGILGRMRDGARAAGMVVRDAPPNREEVIAEGVQQASSRWPCSVLFEDDHAE